MLHEVRDVIRRAVDGGWSGPPFDPIALAEFLGIPLAARDDVRDARTVPIGKDGVRIEFNPNRPAMRVRYSLAHEIAHTLFPDCGALVRNRAAYHEMTGDDEQLEALCNIGAAEILMPAGSAIDQIGEDFSAEDLVTMRRKFEVSTEALAIRIAKMSQFPIAAFCASPRVSERGGMRYHLDYILGSPSWSSSIGHGSLLPEHSVVGECDAIGYTSSGTERWWRDGGALQVACVGIPPYPGRQIPRVVGLAASARKRTNEPPIREVRGDALQPRGSGPTIIAHIVNDATPNWGGGGFAAALRRRYPEVQADFREWTKRSRRNLSLGSTHEFAIDPATTVFHMIAQHGYGDSVKPRIRYAALQTCLQSLAQCATDRAASVHMPRIGTGQARGEWSVIRDILIEEVASRGIDITVYDPPSRVLPESHQTTIAFGNKN
jgi:O-acetyl-ADP-ribose deacetylase (regulator of RNase III)